MAIEAGAAGGGGIDAVSALDQVRFGELLELFHRLAAAAVGAAPTLRKRSPTLLLFGFLVISGLNAPADRAAGRRLAHRRRGRCGCIAGTAARTRRGDYV